MQLVVLLAFLVVLQAVGLGCIEQAAADFLQLDILVEPHHLPDIFLYQGIDPLVFDQIAGLHGIKQEVIAQFGRKTRH